MPRCAAEYHWRRGGDGFAGDCHWQLRDLAAKAAVIRPWDNQPPRGGPPAAASADGLRGGELPTITYRRAWIKAREAALTAPCSTHRSHRARMTSDTLARPRG